MKNFGEIFWQLFLLAAMAATLWLLTGCRTVEREVPVEVRTVVRDTVTETHWRAVRDTVLVRDSVRVTDSVEYRWRERVVLRWRERVDTVYVARTDTVGTPVYVTETRVERRSPWHWRVGLGLVGLAALIIWLVTARRRE